MSTAVACSPMIASAADVDCGGSAPCTLPFDTVVAPGTPLVTLKLDNGTVPWTIAADSGGMGFGQTLGSLPLVLITGAPGNSLIVANNGNIGMGTGSPSAALHVRKASTAKILVENTATAANPLTGVVMFELRRKGTSRFDLVDTNLGATWTFQNRDATLTGVPSARSSAAGTASRNGSSNSRSVVDLGVRRPAAPASPHRARRARVPPAATGLGLAQFDLQLRIAALQRRQDFRQHIGRERGDDAELQPPGQQPAAVAGEIVEITGRRPAPARPAGRPRRRSRSTPLRPGGARPDRPRAPSPAPGSASTAPAGSPSRPSAARPKCRCCGKAPKITQLSQGDHRR